MLSRPHPGATALAGAPGLALAALLAGALPPLLAYNLPPSPTLLNQCLAVGLWGGFVFMQCPRGLAPRGRVLQAATGVMVLAVLLSGLAGALPAALTLSALGLLLAAAALAWAGSEAARRADAAAVFGLVAGGLFVAGLLSTVVALIQVFSPGWTDGNLIAHSGLVGRAVGNLRQPNHLCSLLLWGLVATVALLELGWLPRSLAMAAAVAMVFAIELSGSRTGALGLLLLAAWGALDRRLSRPARRLLLATPLLYGLSFGAMAWYGQWSDQAIGAGARIAAGETGIESPNSRKRIWANTLVLIARQPWTGVGFGEFNLAWSLTPFPGRPTAFFDHTHSLPLQLAVELGLPLAALVLALLVVALWQGWARSQAAEAEHGAAARAAWMLVLLTGWHSLFEYPLWYAYFLLPAAWAWGFALGTPARATAPAGALPTRSPGSPWIGRLAGLVLVAGGALAVYDYRSVVVIYAPDAGAGPLAERIARGQRSLFFAHHADYAAATSADPLAGTPLAFRRAPHYLLDTRLMMAWAKYLAANGQPDRARALAERLREFRNADSEAFFAECDGSRQQPFQCQPPLSPHGWREYLAR